MTKAIFSGFNKLELIKLQGYLDRLIVNISGEQDKGSNINFYEIIAMENQLEKNTHSKEGEGKRC